ncbi:DUF4288 domain-containing protein [Brevibacillus sp. SAFN-007a]|uniref:DUF4288 domain-containing protein n=1 Tax=Brevibacillus sp. SAFN-007a TaxID=3436862 RepID=UPI003F821A7C
MEASSKPSPTRWYAVKILFESVHTGDSCFDRSHGENMKLFEESILVVKGMNKEGAIASAEQFAKKAEHEFVNGYGEIVKHQFVQALDAFELHDDDITHGTEIYSRFIHVRRDHSAMDVTKRYFPEAVGDDGDTSM